jgi:heme O synthase-like polyprenyltransferase
VTANTIKKKSASISFLSYSKYLLLLMKPRVMSLVIFTCAVGLLTAPISVSFLNSIIAIFFVTMGAGAAGALNMWYEADLDKLMTRTCLRPIPTGKVNREHALLFGTVLSRSASYHMFKAPAAPAPIVTKKIAIIEFRKETEIGAVSNPTAQVKITKDITLGFINNNKYFE